MEKMTTEDVGHAILRVCGTLYDAVHVGAVKSEDIADPELAAAWRALEDACAEVVEAGVRVFALIPGMEVA